MGLAPWMPKDRSEGPRPRAAGPGRRDVPRARRRRGRALRPGHPARTVRRGGGIGERHARSSPARDGLALPAAEAGRVLPGRLGPRARHALKAHSLRRASQSSDPGRRTRIRSGSLRAHRGSGTVTGVRRPRSPVSRPSTLLDGPSALSKARFTHRAPQSAPGPFNPRAAPWHASAGASAPSAPPGAGAAERSPVRPLAGAPSWGGPGGGRRSS